MAFGQEIYNLFPNEFYILVHIVAALLGFYLASKTTSGNWKPLMPLFTLYGVSEVAHLLTHLGYFTLPFSHLLQEVLLLVGLLMAWMAMKK